MIILAILVALVLIGLAGYVYYRSQHKADAPVATQTTTTEHSGHVMPADITSTTDSIDKSLNTINDSEDFKSDDLSDATLGL